MTVGAFRELTRHFVGAILTPPILTDLGVDTFRRTLFTLAAGFLSLGLFLPRVFHLRYTTLSALPTPDGYQRALPGDTLFMLALPMLVVGLGAVIISPMLFPDDTDYRVLTPLPLSRAQLFGAKLAALALVAGVGILAVNAVSSLAFPAFSGGRWATHGFVARVLAHGITSIVASAWMVSGVMALQGVCLLLVPESWRARLTMALQASVFLLLLVSVPFLFRFIGRTVSASTVAMAPQLYLPPIWFLGMEQWLLDGTAAGGYATAAKAAAIAWTVTLVIVVAAFVRLFRSAEILAGGSMGRRTRSVTRLRLAGWIGAQRLISGPALGIAGFAARGLVRSRLHQFAFLVVIAGGLAMLLANLAAISEGRTVFDLRPRAAVLTAIAAPLLAALCATLGLRAAFLLPLDRRAAWVFRITDDPRTRARVLNGVATAFAIGALAPALLIGVLLQPRVLGVITVPCLALTTLAVLGLVEVVVLWWRRIPYACSYLPGKRHVAFTAAVLFASYALFVTIGANLLRWGALHPSHTLFLGGLLLSAFAALRRARLQTSGADPLEFEDEEPDARILLRL